MNATLLTLRVVHILCVVYWAGTILFVATFLEPTTREVGPAAAPVMFALQRRGYFNVLPVIAALAVLSGATLLWIDSNGFDAAWMGSRPGIAYSTGGLAALIGFTIGMLVMRPTMLKVSAIMAAAPKVPEGAAREAHLAPVPVLRRRVTTSVRWTAGLLAVAATAMAVARYLG